MALPFYNWSRVAASNATADSTVNWAEGQAPSSINDSARAMMASTAAFRDDISGAITTGGTSTAYTVTTYQVFDTLAHMNGQVVAFTPHTTNGATVTLNVDGLGAKPLRSAPSVELLAGTIIQGTPYVATYNNSDGAFYLQGFFGNPYNVPLGAGMPYFLNTTPNSSFVFPFGQAVSRTTYSTLFASMSTTFGNGDGSTTFNLPDLRGRVPAGADAMGGSAASRLTSANISGGAANGNAGGSETQTLVTANLPPYTPAGSVSGSATIGQDIYNGTAFGSASSGFILLTGPNGTHNFGAHTSDSPVSGTFTGTAQGGTSTPVNTVQPTLCCNYIIRII